MLSLLAKVKVFIECRTGTIRMVGGAWENEYHIIHWADMTFEEYLRFKLEQMSNHAGGVLRVFFEEIK